MEPASQTLTCRWRQRECFQTNSRRIASPTSRALVYTVLILSETTASVPLVMDQAGVLRVNGTRVSLDSVIFAFNEGSTPEEIAQQYTTLNLADIYAVISYYLQNHDEVVEYLRGRKTQRAELRKEVESRFDPQGIRDRLLARKRPRTTD
jgi:uncharacterized protein (DUF433 family)